MYVYVYMSMYMYMSMHTCIYIPLTHIHSLTHTRQETCRVCEHSGQGGFEAMGLGAGRRPFQILRPACVLCRSFPAHADVRSRWATIEQTTCAGNDATSSLQTRLVYSLEKERTYCENLLGMGLYFLRCGSTFFLLSLATPAVSGRHLFPKKKLF